jgi:hypothetical protein
MIFTNWANPKQGSHIIPYMGLDYSYSNSPPQSELPAQRSCRLELQRSRRGRRRGDHRWWRWRRWRRHHWWRPRQGRRRQMRGHPRWRRRDRPRPALVDVHRLGEARRGRNRHRLGAGCRRNGHRRPWARDRCCGKNHSEGRGHRTRVRHRVGGRTGGRRAGTRCRRRPRWSRTCRK